MIISARFIFCIAAVFLGQPPLQNPVQDKWLYRGIYVDKYTEMAGDMAKENDFRHTPSLTADFI